MALSFESGRRINNGITTVIIGRPNAGKSSLMNLILGEERAIVTRIPGTTRDTISETVTLGNVMLRLTDTAGLRESKDEIERIGIDKTLHNADRAELILCVIDGSDKTMAELDGLITLTESKDGKKIYIINKTDIADRTNIDDIRDRITRYKNVKILGTNGDKSESGKTEPEDIENGKKEQDTKKVEGEEDCREVKQSTENREREDHSIIELSTKTGDGLGALTEEIESLFGLGNISYNDEIVISSIRQLELLKRAINSLQELKTTMDAGMPEDLYGVDLMNTYGFLGEILGEEVDEDLINEIFSKFCMGK